MNTYPDHGSDLVALKRIEGQLRGIQKMIQERKYCVDILTQVHAAMKALASVEDKILEGHLNGCVTSALQGKSSADKEAKIKEVLALVKQFRKF